MTKRDPCFKPKFETIYPPRMMLRGARPASFSNMVILEGPMGDNYSYINGSILVVKSTAVTAMSKAESIGGPDTSNILEKVNELVSRSNDQIAIAYLNRFNEELSKPQPSKMFLKDYWDGIAKTLPAVTAIAGATGALAKLFV